MGSLLPPQVRRLAAGLACAPLLLAAAPAGIGWPEVDARVAEAKGAMITEPGKALVAADAALAFVAAHPGRPQRTLAEATGGWLKGEALIRLNRAGEAMPVIESALAKAHEVAPGAKLEGDLLKARGLAAGALGRVQPALADFHKAFQVFGAAKVPRSQAIVLQNIGAIYSDARDWEHVIKYYRQSAEVFSDDPTLALVAHNNLGNAYRKSGRLDLARQEFSAALQLARETGSGAVTAQVLANLAELQIRDGQMQEADAALTEAEHLAATDAGAHEWRAQILGVRAELQRRRGDLRGAATALGQAFAGQDLARTPLTYRDAHETASQVYAALGQDALALQHLRAFKRLDDDAREVAASTNAALMGAQFDFANQELKIAQRDMALTRSKARSQAIIAGVAGGAGAIVLALVLFGYFAMRKSRNAVRDANTQLESTNDALGRALKAKTEFLATTSHEIRTPLNGVLGMTQVLLADANLGAGVRSRIELVRDAGETMRSMVDDLLDAAKLETGGVTVSRADFDLHRMLEELLAFWLGQAGNRGLALTLDAEGAPAWIREDETRLRQLLSNLVSNALKFTEAGSVAITARAEGERLHISVADTGIGVAAADLERIFEPFTQVDSSVTRRFSGTGLGLSICRDVARAMEGQVTVESRLGEGSTFHLDLPLRVAEAPAAVDARARSGPPATLAEAAVLVAEPNALARAVLRAVLQAEAREVRLCDDLAGAEAELAKGGVDLVLAADAVLAGASSPEDGARRLVEAAAGAPVTLLTTQPTAGIMAALLPTGLRQILQRPIPAEQLVAAMQAVCATSAPEASNPQSVVRAA